MLVNGQKLELERCPHCAVHKPSLTKVKFFETKNHSETRSRIWHLYACASCGGMVMTSARSEFPHSVEQMWPDERSVSDDISPRARQFLTHAINSLHTPPGAVMLAGSAIDAMLKDKGFRDGTLYKRIDEAAAQHLLTPEMATWAHEIRLDANDQRHADDNAPLPDEADAEKAILFAEALAEFLYVLPAMVERGRRGPQAGEPTA